LLTGDIARGEREKVAVGERGVGVAPILDGKIKAAPAGGLMVLEGRENLLHLA
jgi:hypothetical protein